MTSRPAIRIDNLSHRYGEREAVRNLSFDVDEGEIFALLGPNGSGKTTLFRVLSTLIPLQQGRVEIFGLDLASQTPQIRSLLGVVFQAPSLDKKLTVRENLLHQGPLYGLGGGQLTRRVDELLARFGLADRAGEATEKLSGGQRRRVELAKGLLHSPRLVLLDEPSTGLDPGARSDLWRYLTQLRDTEGVTVVLTTHILEEAQGADRLGIMHQGEMVALDTPAALRATIGGDSITIQTDEPEAVAALIREHFACDADVVDGAVRLERPDGGAWVARLAEVLTDRALSITLGKPTLEDVFIERTGHRFWSETR
jgi:ABC-2 type transport system ATP-binding protein